MKQDLILKLIEMLVSGDSEKADKCETASPESNTNKMDRFIGKYVICRTRNEGVNAGTVLEIGDSYIVLAEAQRLYYHKPNDSTLSWYEGVAVSGLSSDSKIGSKVEKVLSEDFSLTICTSVAKKSIQEHKPNEQN